MKEFDAIFGNHKFIRDDLMGATNQLKSKFLRNETKEFAMSNILFLSEKITQ